MRINRCHPSRNALIIGVAVVVIGLGVGGGVFGGIIDEYTAQVLTLGGINVIVALSLNLAAGFAGQLVLGQAGFMAVGAYTTALLVMRWQTPLLAAVGCGGVVAAFCGLVIGFPVLRLRGDYLAIVTLGFGEVIRTALVNLEGLTGGAAGLKGIPTFTETLSLRPTVAFIWVYAFMAGTILVVADLINSAPGRAVLAVREDEIAADAMGINVFYYKMLAFTFAAGLAGIAGSLYAPFFRYLNPTMFNFLKSVDFLIIAVLGGMGSITGTVCAGFGLTYLQELLRVVNDYRMVVYPLLLILLMLFRPAGLMGGKELDTTRVVAGLGDWWGRWGKSRGGAAR
jgi:branched-chain amino acid transport system permease protein